MAQLTLEEIKKLPPRDRIQKIKEFEEQQKKAKEEAEKKQKSEEEEIIKRTIEELTEEKHRDEEEEKIVERQREKKQEIPLEQIAEQAPARRQEKAHEYFVAQEYQTNLSHRPPAELYERAKELREEREQRGYLPTPMQQEAENIRGAVYMQEKRGYFENQKSGQLKSRLDELFEDIVGGRR